MSVCQEVKVEFVHVLADPIWNRPYNCRTVASSVLLCLSLIPMASNPSVCCSVAPILYRLSIYLLYRPKILVSAIGNITKCILITKILHFYGKIDHKIVKLCTER